MERHFVTLTQADSGGVAVIVAEHVIAAYQIKVWESSDKSFRFATNVELTNAVHVEVLEHPEEVLEKIEEAMQVAF